MTPQKIDRYEIQAEIGRGGMATVYKAYDPRFERPVAVKVLPREFMHEPEFRARFKREAKTIAALEHPAIVPVYDYGEDDGQLYLVMRYMPGGSLADRLQDGPLPIEEAAVILQRLGSALDRAHSQGIIHRDLKPSNVLFDQYGDAFLADFGIVRVTSASSALTASGSLVGTPTYMSPEQVYGDKELDGRSDIYALGIILFQMLTGQLPYEADTPAKVMMKHVLDPVPHVLDKRPDLPPAYDDVVTKAMAKERDERFPTATDFTSALAAATPRSSRRDFAAELEAIHSQLTLAESPLERPARPAPPPSAEEPAAVASPPAAGQPVTKRPVAEPAAAPAAAGKRGLLPWVWVTGGLVLLCLATSVAVVVWTLAGDPSFTAGEATATIGGRAGTPTTELVVYLEPTVAETVVIETPAPSPTVTAAATVVVDTAATTVAQATAVAATRDNALTLRATLVASATEAAATAAAEGRQPDVAPLFGPIDGDLLHELDGKIEVYHADVEAGDFIAQATFDNPYATAIGTWDIGFLFRQTDADQELRLVIESDRSWALNDRRGSEDTYVHEGRISGHFDISARGSNTVTLIAYGERGYFLSNNEFVAVLDLSGRTGSGDLGIGTGFYTDNERRGATTRYHGFTVWPMESAFGPGSGALTHVDDGLIKTRPANVTLFNSLIEATFRNPYALSTGSWDIGFTFRQTAASDQFWLVVESDGAWSLVDRRGGQDNFLEDGQLTGLDASAGGTNRLTLIALDERGYLLFNDTFVTVLDLSSRLEAGEVEIVTAFYIGNEVDGQVTEYTDFTVWPLP